MPRPQTQEGEYRNVAVTPRSQSLTKASRVPDLHSSSPNPITLSARGPPVKLTVYDGTGKYIMLQMTGLVVDASFKNFIYSAFLYLEAYVTRFDEGDLIRGGHFDWLSPPSHSLDVWNANNHQVTYGMLQMTIAAIYDYMGVHGFETATFAMFDGANQVGIGNIK